MDVTGDTPSRIGAHTAQATVLRAARVIVWDEASMTPKSLFAYADAVLQDLTGNKGVPFGGKIVVVGGDWRQILPVVPFGDRAETIAATIQMHYTWREKRFRMFPLTRNMRVATASAGTPGDGNAYRDWLLAVGDGRVPANAALTMQAIPLPLEIAMPKGSDKTALLDWVYADLEHHAADAATPLSSVSRESRDHADDYFRQRAILTPLNAIVEELNAELLERLPAATEIELSLIHI